MGGFNELGDLLNFGTSGASTIPQLGATEIYNQGQNSGQASQQGSRSQFDLSLDPFRGAVDEQGNLINQNIAAFGDLNTQLRGLGGQLGGVGDQFGAIAAGDDPRFQAFQDAQLAQMAAQRGQAAGGLNTNLRRTGVGGTLAQNEQSALNTGFDLREQSLTSGLGLQQLGRQDAALGAQAGIISQQAGLVGAQGGLLEGQTGLGQLGVQNQLAIPTLGVASTAAQNAGADGGKK